MEVRSLSANRLPFLHQFTRTVTFAPLWPEDAVMSRARTARLNHRAFVFALMAGALLLAGVTRLRAQGFDDIIVTYDQSQILRLSRPAAEIIIGNPVIADIAVQSGSVLVITGKSFGITNMIALDANKQIIFDRRIFVKRDDARVVNLQRGPVRQTYNCTPNCNPTVTIGDDQEYFDTTMKAAEKKTSMSEKAASRQ